jgi:hypothetical protein
MTVDDLKYIRDGMQKIDAVVKKAGSSDQSNCAFSNLSSYHSQRSSRALLSQGFKIFLWCGLDSVSCRWSVCRLAGHQIESSQKCYRAMHAVSWSGVLWCVV